MKQNQGAEKWTYRSKETTTEQKKKKPFNMFIFIMTCFVLLSPLWLLLAFVVKMRGLSCIDVTNKMYMFLGITFIYAYIIKYYFHFFWRKDE